MDPGHSKVSLDFRRDELQWPHCDWNDAITVEHHHLYNRSIVKIHPWMVCSPWFLDMFQDSMDWLSRENLNRKPSIFRFPVKCCLKSNPMKSSIFPWNHHFPMVFHRFSYGFPMTQPETFDFPMKDWLFHRFSIDFSWLFSTFPSWSWPVGQVWAVAKSGPRPCWSLRLRTRFFWWTSH